MARILAVVRSDGPSLAQRENFMGRTTLSGEVTETSQTFIPIGAGVLSNDASSSQLWLRGVEASMATVFPLNRWV